ncbi:hypothetical protein BDU57DRAFT_542319 [Ampelomyces quisqualis]|uniref:Uncharacterized protein n=1 Tax=Ampelomyces quisqualis TaxID=50730 RepID=A0A6A5QCC1_AMPQU|nr:hypothetical protein BDU57DRAFT_542319 [Ampelomyces quisqualis]
MRRIQSSWAILLMLGAGAAEAGLDLPNSQEAPQVIGERIDHQVSGIKRTQNNAIVVRAPNSGLDVAAMMDSISQDQGGDKAKQNANQIAGGSSSLDQIIGGLGAQSPTGENNQLVTETGTPKKGGKGNAQGGSGNGLLIEILQTTVREANGQEVKTAIVKEVGQAQAAATPAATPNGSIAAQAKPTPPTESLMGAKNTTAAAEAVKSTPGAEMTQSLAQTWSATKSVGEPATGSRSAQLAAATVQGEASTGGNSTLAAKAGSGATEVKMSLAAAVTMNAGSGGNGSSPNASTSAVREQKSALAAVTINAGSGATGGAANGTSTRAATAQGAGQGSGAATSAAMPPAITVEAGSNLTSSTRASPAGAVATVVAGTAAGNVTSAEQAARNGGCNCQCMCPAGSFPNEAPAGPAFQLGSMGPSASTLQTQASSGAEGAQAGQSSSSAATSSAAAASSAASTTEAPSVPVQSQIQGNTGGETTAGPAANGLPFNIQTVSLQSRVTVNLGRRLAQPTQTRRGWW